MHEYELTIVLPGKVTPAKKKAFSEKLEKILKVSKGKISEEKDWGEIELSYKIKKDTTGTFLHFVLELDGALTKTLNGKLRAEGEIIRYLLIRKNG